MHLFTVSDYVTGERFRVVRCNRCGLAYTNPRPTQEAMPRYYPPEYHTAHSDPVRRTVETLIRQVRYRRNRQVLQWLQANQRFAPDRAARVLDIGCGRGWQLHDLRMHGVDAVGTELSEEAAGFARYELGLDVRVGLLEDGGFAPESFDLIMAWHSLEHLPSPRRTLAEAHRLLRQGGHLLVAVPNLGSLQARIAGQHWLHLDVPRHTCHFSRHTLVRLLNDIGLTDPGSERGWSQPAHCRGFRKPSGSITFDACGWTQSLLNMSGLAPNFLYGLVRYGAGPVKTMRSLRRAWNLGASLTLLPGLAAIGLLGAGLGSWLGQGAALQVVAAKIGAK